MTERSDHIRPSLTTLDEQSLDSTPQPIVEYVNALTKYIDHLESRLEKGYRTTQRLLLTSVVAVTAALIALVVIFAPRNQPNAATMNAAVLPALLTVRERFAEADDFVVYYGTGQVGELSQYDVAIIQPDTLVEPDLRLLALSGTLPLAYLSIGEVEPNRPWFTDGSVPEAWHLGTNPIWGSSYIDVSQPGWQDLMISLSGQYLTRGFRGVFLDTVDTVDLFPNLREPMIELVARLRETHPNMVIVQNRGFTVMDETAGYIDGIMFESLTASYDFDTDQYIQLRPENSEAVVERIRALRQNHNVQILVLDYALEEDTAGISAARERAQSLGFLFSVADINLQQIYAP